MTTSQLKVGDRVRLRATRHTVQAGALGTVQEVLSAVNAYIIAFAGLVGPRFVWGNILEQVGTEAGADDGWGRWAGRSSPGFDNSIGACYTRNISKESIMQPPEARLALVRSDIAILHEQLDQAAEQLSPDHDRQFVLRELLTSQQMYHALIRNRRRKLRTKAVGD